MNKISNKRTYGSCCMCGPIKTPSVSRFQFPTDPIKKAEWLKFCDMKPEHLKASYKLCSGHFSANCISIKGNLTNKQRLKPGAVPSIHCESFWDSDDSSNEKTDILKSNITDRRNNDEITNIPYTESENAEAHSEPVHSPLHYVDNYIEEEILYASDTSEDCSIIAEIIRIDNGNKYPKKKRLSYAGDIEMSDLCSPQRAQRCFEIYKKQLMTYKRKNDILRARLRRIDMQNKKYKEIIKNLREQLWE